MADTDIDEKALLPRLVDGDSAAFEILFRRHNAAMIRFCTGLVPSRQSAEEVVQETWVSVLDRIHLFEGRGLLASWIYAILINRARTVARRENRMVFFDDGGEGDGLADAFDGRGRWRNMPELWDDLTPDRHVEGRSLLDHLEAAIDALPPGQRAVLMLRCQQDLPPGDVCALLGIGEGNMRVLLHRARINLRNAIDRLLKDP